MKAASSLSSAREFSGSRWRASPRSSCANRTRLRARNNRTLSWMKLKHLGHDPVMDAALEQQERIGGQIIGAERVVPHAERPGAGGHVERRRLLGFVQQVERVAGLAVELDRIPRSIEFPGSDARKRLSFLTILIKCTRLPRIKFQWCEVVHT